ncbi:c-type cytochrome [Mycobacterium tuberculosis]
MQAASLAATCANCHGTNGQGVEGGGPSWCGVLGDYSG